MPRFITVLYFNVLLLHWKIINKKQFSETIKAHLIFAYARSAFYTLLLQTSFSTHVSWTRLIQIQHDWWAELHKVQ